MGDAPFRGNGAGFEDQKPSSGLGEIAKMLIMPGLHLALLGGVLTHGRDDDAIVQRERAEGER